MPEYYILAGDSNGELVAMPFTPSSVIGWTQYNTLLAQDADGELCGVSVKSSLRTNPIGKDQPYGILMQGADGRYSHVTPHVWTYRYIAGGSGSTWGDARADIASTEFDEDTSPTSNKLARYDETSGTWTIERSPIRIYSYGQNITEIDWLVRKNNLRIGMKIYLYHSTEPPVNGEDVLSWDVVYESDEFSIGGGISYDSVSGTADLSGEDFDPHEYHFFTILAGFDVSGVLPSGGISGTTLVYMSDYTFE